ncbi:MAG: hypothetical protein N4A62_20480 [Marinisporobacter sp.]|jgi:hypothetical protein|nr:hypothetical protein [Marinisporobacter sp.]
MTINRKVSKVLRIIDFVTGKDVNKNLLHLTVNEKNIKPIFKRDGYIVFTDLEEELFHLHISSPIYLSQIVYEKMNNHFPNDEVIYIYLYPNESYPHKENLIWVQGKVDEEIPKDENIEYYLAFESNQMIKIAQEEIVKGQNKVRLFVSNNKRIVGKSFWITGGKNDEFCSVMRDLAKENFYQLKKVLKYDHYRGEKLYPTIKVKIDDNGCFNGFIPSKLCTKEEVFLVNNENILVKKIQLNLI